MTRSMEKEGVLSMRKCQRHICPIKFIGCWFSVTPLVKLGRLNSLISGCKLGTSLERNSCEIYRLFFLFYFNYTSFLLVQNVGLHIALVFSCSINTIACHYIKWITVVNRKTTQTMVLVYVVSLTGVSALSCHSCMFLWILPQLLQPVLPFDLFISICFAVCARRT